MSKTLDPNAPNPQPAANAPKQGSKELVEAIVESINPIPVARMSPKEKQDLAWFLWGL
jgi:hypothetical protein